ncbi:uncharacterized protein EV422DRAFT_540115 [Fimicolochytrium jonesii]|uniref:uncharacterized protein n=1 Tax=Fimicolochytrium jonesii TaxID=1396493 RepID=UPI0022FDCC5A|nr:uncharacterized protein EV422DRAFT_540115 [Fimicolochytrium jonesii]KAI8817825.1 hypothetical protein EV422DRAFT_540115 [Fimicolochytrium jonesii]
MASTDDRRQAAVEEGGGDTTKIADLAVRSTRHEAHTYLPAVPLTVFAPMLVIVALLATLIPTFKFLSDGSTVAVNTLSHNYLDTLMDQVSDKISFAVKQYIPLVEVLTASPSVVSTFAGTARNLNTAPWVSDIIRMELLYGLDTIGCTQAVWRSGFSPANVNGNNVTTDTAQLVQMSAYRAYGMGYVVYKSDWDDPTANTSLYFIDKKAYTIPSTPAAYQPIAQFSMATNQQLGLLPVRNRTYWNAYVSNYNTFLAYVTTPHFPTATSQLPNYHCSAGIRVDTTWHDVLAANKPSPDSVITLFNQALVNVASSNTFPNDTAIQSNNKFILPVTDALTLALQATVRSKFGTFDDVASVKPTRYEDVEIIGYPGSWILLTKRISVSTFPDQDNVLVLAIPREVVYGATDAAWKKAIRVSIGVAVALAVVSAIVFVFAVLPLFKLARAMAVVTTLDFSTLEESNVLDERSVFSEIRRVQIVFSTMVKAFAGAIKKNKEMSAGPRHRSISKHQTSSH